MPPTVLFNALREFHAARTQGAVAVHCRNAANRSAIFAVAYLIAISGETVEICVFYAHKIRKLVDITSWRQKDGKHITKQWKIILMSGT